MCEENKIIELKDEDLKEASGGLTVADICPECPYFLAKDYNGGRNKDNCQSYNSLANYCRGWSNAGGETKGH